MKRLLFFPFLLIMMVFTKCETLNKFPSNTSGGLFSLNGNWKLTSNNDNSLTGTVVTVFPGVNDATIKSLQQNTKCFRENDIIWKALKSQSGGGFTFDNLVNACNGLTIYKPASITILTNNEIRITGQRDNGTELLQTWQRVVSN